MLTEIDGNILESDAQYIVHQCNCVTDHASGLAYKIFRKYPYSDTYRSDFLPENKTRKPGTIHILGDGEGKRFVINLYGQVFPGKINKGGLDTEGKRLRYFINALKEISEIEGLRSVAFPKKIGCDLAGGNWGIYRELIEDFADNNPDVEVLIIDFAGKEDKDKFITGLDGLWED